MSCGSWRRELIDRVAVAGGEGRFVRPALREDALEVRRDDALVAQLETRVEVEDRLARALDQATGLAMRDGEVGADEVQRQLDDHPDTAKSAPFVKRGADFRRRIDFKLGHHVVVRSNRGPATSIPAFTRVRA